MVMNEYKMIGEAIYIRKNFVKVFFDKENVDSDNGP
jgi:hypothetical protein